MRRVRARVSLSACQAPYSAKDSRAFQAAGRSRARADWVMVCSSTLSARAVIHSAKRRKPRRVNEWAKPLSRACQVDQVSVASVMVRLLCRGRTGQVTTRQVPTRRRRLQGGTSDQILCLLTGKLLYSPPARVSLADATPEPGPFIGSGVVTLIGLGYSWLRR